MCLDVWLSGRRLDLISALKVQYTEICLCNIILNIPIDLKYIDLNWHLISHNLYVCSSFGPQSSLNYCFCENIVICKNAE